MIDFTRKKLKSKTLGEKLRQLREEAQIDLAEIAKNTRVRKEYLERIEQGKFNELPPDVYVKGFLKSYAGYLGIDSRNIIEQYEKERGIQNNLKKINFPKVKKSRFNLPSITITPRAFSVVFFSLFLIAGFFYFYKEIDKFSENPRLVIIQPLSDISIDGSSIEIIGLTDKNNKISINDQPVFVNEEGEFQENIGLQKGLNEITVKAENRFEKTSQKKFNVSANYELKVAGEETERKESLIENEKIKIEITVKEFPVWVAVKVDSSSVQSGTMLPDSTQVFEGTEKILITSGKANKTFLKLNGEEIGALDESPGVIRDVIFTKNSNAPIKTAPSEESKPERNNDNG